MEVSNCNIGNSNINTTSGDIDLSLTDLGDNNIFRASSGDIELRINNNIPYTIDFTTTSGDLSSMQDFSKNNKRYTYVNDTGDKKVNIFTTSGDFDFYN